MYPGYHNDIALSNDWALRPFSAERHGAGTAKSSKALAETEHRRLSQYPSLRTSKSEPPLAQSYMTCG